MPIKNPDLHGSAPDKCKTALRLIDVINDLEFPEADRMVDAAVKMARSSALDAARQENGHAGHLRE